MALSPPPGWTRTGAKITKKYQFKSFMHAMGFMAEIALFCDKTNHHPEWKNIYTSLWVELSTHDAGDVTDKDITLAKEMDSIFTERYQ